MAGASPLPAPSGAGGGCDPPWAAGSWGQARGQTPAQENPPGSLEQDPGHGHRSVGCSGCRRDGDGVGAGEDPGCCPHELPTAQGAAGNPQRHPGPTASLYSSGSRAKGSGGATDWAGKPPKAALLRPPGPCQHQPRVPGAAPCRPHTELYPKAPAVALQKASSRLRWRPGAAGASRSQWHRGRAELGTGGCHVGPCSGAVPMPPAPPAPPTHPAVSMKLGAPIPDPFSSLGCGGVVAQRAPMTARAVAARRSPQRRGGSLGTLLPGGAGEGESGADGGTWGGPARGHPPRPLRGLSAHLC